MRIAILTNEYPPHIYGGAGVHVAHLTRELVTLDASRHSVKVLCFGDQHERQGNLEVDGIRVDFPFPVQDPRHHKLLEALFRNLLMAGTLKDVDIIHCHTWYTHLAGCLLKQLLGKPLVLTTHSLEPHRPWKEEQLGSGYQVSTWLEKTAYQNADGVIAVSRAMREDVHELYGVPLDKVRVIPNGVDVRLYRPTEDPKILARYGIDPKRPYILFVGRISRQKGITLLLGALEEVKPEVQAVLCAADPDSPEIGREVESRIAELQNRGRKVVWIARFVPPAEIVPLYSQAAVFVCPSIYEPFGIINLEAMACGTPVVATAVGGIPEVVVHGETGLLVPFDPRSPEDPGAGKQLARALAEAINELLEDPERRAEMGKKARSRVEGHFSWQSVARQTLDFYHELVRAG